MAGKNKKKEEDTPTWDETLPVSSVAPTPSPEMSAGDVPSWDDTSEVSFDETKTPEEHAAQKLDENLQNPPVSGLEATLAGLADGYTASYGDELIARGKSLFGSQSYDDYLTQEHEHMARAKAQHPVKYNTANIVGAFISPVTKVLGPAKHAGKAANVVRAALTGGVFGSGASLGDVTTEEGRNQIIRDTADGAMWGVGTYGAASGIAAGAKAFAPPVLDKFAKWRAVKAATGQNKRVLREAHQMGQLEKIGEDLLQGSEELGIQPTVRFGSSVDAIGDRAATHADKAWDAVEEVYKSIDKTTGGKTIKGLDIASNILNYVRQIERLPKNMPTIKRMMDEAKWIATKPYVSLERAQRIKNNYVFKLQDSRTHALGLDGNGALRKAYAEAIENAVSTHGLAGDADKFQKGMRLYGSMATATKSANDRMIANVSNRFISPSDYGVGGMAGMTKALDEGGSRSDGLYTAVASALAHKILRERGSSAAAKSAWELSKLIKKHPNTLGHFQRFLSKGATNQMGPALSFPTIQKDAYNMWPHPFETEE